MTTKIFGKYQIEDNSISSQQVDTSVLTASSEYHDLPSDVASAAGTGSSALYSPGDHIHRGVHSISATGSARLYGDIQFVGASGTVVSQSGQIVYIAGGSGGGASLYGSNPADVASAAAVGSSPYASPGDHVHKGLHSIAVTGSASIYGDAFITVGQGLVLSESGQVINLVSTVTGSYNASTTTPVDVASAGVVGTSTDYSRGDHTHKGLHSVNVTGSAQLFGDVNIIGGPGVVLTQAGQAISISATGIAQLTSTAPSDVAGAAVIGTAITSAHADHVHRGLHSAQVSGSSAIFNDLFITAGNGIVLSETSPVISISTNITGSYNAYTVTPADVASTGAVGTVLDYARGDHAHKGLHSINATGSSQLFGDVNLVAGAGIALTEAGQMISIKSTVTGSYGVYPSNPADVASAAVVGTSLLYAAGDHAHKGLHSINATGSAQLFGDVNLIGGAGISLVESAQAISIVSTITGSYGVYPSNPADVASAAVVGTSLLYSAGDHAHKGLHSINATGSAQLFGDVNLVAGPGVTLTEAGQMISISATGIAQLTSAAPADVASAASVGTAILAARGDHAHRGVTSINATGSSVLYGAVAFSPGAGITLSQVGQQISIVSTVTGSYNASTILPVDVAASAVIGTSTNYTREDHVHKGVHSVAASGSSALYGDVQLLGASGTTVSQVGNIIYIAGALSAAGTGSSTTLVHTHSDATSGGATIDANMFTRGTVVASGSWQYVGNVGINVAPATNTELNVTAVATGTALAINASTSQTADLLRINDNSGNKKIWVAVDGSSTTNPSLVLNNISSRLDPNSTLELVHYYTSGDLLAGGQTAMFYQNQYIGSAQSQDMVQAEYYTSYDNATGTTHGLTALFFQANKGNNGAISSLAGVSGLAYNGGSGTISVVYGMSMNTQNGGAGLWPDTNVIYAQGTFYSTANITYWRGYRVNLSVDQNSTLAQGSMFESNDLQYTATGTPRIATLYGMKIGQMVGPSTVYGLYISNVTGTTTTWSMYTNGGRHSFKDEVIIGQPSSYDATQALYVYGNIMAAGNSANTVGQIYTSLDSIGTTDMVLKRPALAYQSMIHFYTAGNEYAQMGTAAGTGSFTWNTSRTDSSLVLQTLGVNRLVIDPLVGIYLPNNVGNPVAYFGNSGTIALGNNLGNTFASTSGTSLYLSASGTYNGENLRAGDLIIGENSASKANIKFNRANSRIEFRGNKSVMSYIDTDGTLVAGNFLINSTGIIGKGLSNSQPQDFQFQTSVGTVFAYGGAGDSGGVRQWDTVILQVTGTSNRAAFQWFIYHTNQTQMNRMNLYGPDNTPTLGSTLGSFTLLANNTEFYRAEPYGIKMTAVASVTGTPPIKLLELIGAANTNIPAATENNDILLNLARTVKWAGNSTITTQRAMYIQAPTYGASAPLTSGTFTNSATVAISGPPASDGTAVFTNVPSALWVQSGKTQLDGILNLGTTTVPTTRVIGNVRRDSTLTHYIYYDDGVQERSLPHVGWMPYAYPLGGGPTQTTTTARTLISGTALAINMVLESHMLAQSITIWNTDSATARTGEWRLYEDRLNNSSTINMIAGATGTFSFTPGAPAAQTSTIGIAPLYLAPGAYWLVIRPTNAAGFSIGETPAGTMALNTAQGRTGTALATTLDMVTGWSKLTSVLGVRINGRVFGQATAF